MICREISRRKEGNNYAIIPVNRPTAETPLKMRRFDTRSGEKIAAIVVCKYRESDRRLVDAMTAES